MAPPVTSTCYDRVVLDPRDLGRAEDDAERERLAELARMTPEERLRIFVSLCDLTDSITRGRPDAEALRAPTPRSPESEALWQRLMERARGR